MCVCNADTVPLWVGTLYSKGYINDFSSIKYFPRRINDFSVTSANGDDLFGKSSKNEVFIKGQIKGTTDLLFITKHIYKEHIQMLDFENT